MEIEVYESANCPFSLTRGFDCMDAPSIVTKVMAPNSMGEEQICDVTGWSSAGPCPAYSVLVEDSGEGIVMLIYGGDEGIRLKPVDEKEAWLLSSPRQWGEPCLLATSKSGTLLLRRDQGEMAVL